MDAQPAQSGGGRAAGREQHAVDCVLFFPRTLLSLFLQSLETCKCRFAVCTCHECTHADLCSSRCFPRSFSFATVRPTSITTRGVIAIHLFALLPIQYVSLAELDRSKLERIAA